ncbi:MAG TPA: dTDP-4-dehydrorhamnose reductase [Gemmatimonadales bacterium]|nr:dTDP-4-dehydrorhamnose reductase [Gemmatimonadales bacterium]
MNPAEPGKVLITGAQGQVGMELQATAPTAWRVLACGSSDLDVTDADAVRELLERERPVLIIQAAAYTDVDTAEHQVEQAEAVNVAGASNVAAAATRIGARMIHLSTDFVFDGAQGRPYVPGDPAKPLGIYGRTKLAGEREVSRLTRGVALIVRTAWVYSAHGGNFVRTMLRLMREQDSVKVVSDQVGTPTWGRKLAEALWVAADRPSLHGIVHWTDAGVASWYDFAVAIQEEALILGLLPKAVPVHPIRTEEYPTPARRPPYSVLDKTSGWAALGGPARHWRANLRTMLQGLAHA